MTRYKRCRNSFHVSTCSLENDVPVRANGIIDDEEQKTQKHD